MDKPEEEKWTLMFYLASDTNLAPEIISQLKSIKQAGFHPNVNVIARFDPNLEIAETHIFDINRVNKIQAKGESKIGFVGFTPNDPYVVNLMTDKLWGEQRDTNNRLIRDRLITSLTSKGFQFDPPTPPASIRKDENGNLEELPPELSLASFLDFCRKYYPARRYMLFILGHGLVVGNDTFLFDENAPEHSLQLKPLGVLLNKFKEDIAKKDGVPTGAELELISFHSCSMSSLEVAFEIQGIANYMLASQSPSFVGSWPYRQILIRIFNYLDRKERGLQEVDIKGMFKNIFHYCAYHGLDYLVAGYSNDACLCDLKEVPKIQYRLSELSASLIDGLNWADPQGQELVRESILLSHLAAQSYFNENYTDLFDFCFRLQQRLKTAAQEPPPAEVKAIKDACQNVMEKLERGIEGDDDERLVVRSEFIGPAYQYSHGLSVYFPWSQPFNGRFWPREYNRYKFSSVFADAQQKSWSDFLTAYFTGTRRHTRADEFKATALNSETALNSQGVPGITKETRELTFQEELLEAFSTGVLRSDGQLQGKPSPNSSQGDGCDCQSIKNYPPFTRERIVSGAPGNVSVSPTSLRDPTFTLNGTPTFAVDGIE